MRVLSFCTRIFVILIAPICDKVLWKKWEMRRTKLSRKESNGCEKNTQREFLHTDTTHHLHWSSAPQNPWADNLGNSRPSELPDLGVPFLHPLGQKKQLAGLLHFLNFFELPLSFLLVSFQCIRRMVHLGSDIWTHKLVWEYRRGQWRGMRVRLDFKRT